MKNDGLKPKLIKVDGGMVQNNWFSQFLSDTINIKVLRPNVGMQPKFFTKILGKKAKKEIKIGTPIKQNYF